ncbi:MAG: glycosyl transferase, partial [Alistipes sp.]|nr:glycosyl transferase [Alistipes sp.]
RTGGSIESVTADTGLVVEQGDIEGLLKAAREVTSKGKAYYVPRCRAYALANFRKEDRYADYLRLYDEMLKVRK